MTKNVIICVDDELTILTSLKAELRKSLSNDYIIEIAEGGEDALELLKELMAENYEIPLIISDYVMPEMKGDELLRRVHDISPKTLKVMLTGQATIEAVANAVKYAKLYRYLAKPWQNEDLILTVREAIYSYHQDRNIAKKNAQFVRMNQELKQLTLEQSKLIAELHKKERILEELNESFLRFVPRQFLQLLDKSSIIDIQLGDQIQQEISVLFSDIRDFTSLSERMTPQDNFKFINSYLSWMEPVILENNGFIDKYIGDAIMALFNGNVDHAVNAGIAMLQALAEYNITYHNPDLPPIKIGIGINTGISMLGIVGGQSRMDGTVIGDTVNVAARIEELTKHYGVPLLISDCTYFELQKPEAYSVRFIGQAKVKGKVELVGVYEVFDADSPPLRDAKFATKTKFEQALIFCHQKEFKEAAKLLEECLQKTGPDTVAQIYLARCQQALGK
ncbi:adenylate/guanylate cyclase domain-containing protein [Phormidium nigroviride]